MSLPFTPEQLLAVAKASPIAVARHDSEAWLDLFATEYSLEDPVGSKPHTPRNYGKQPLKRFFNTFIAPSDITFHVDQDIVSGNFVLRDVTIELNMAAGVKAFVPMHIIYEMIDECGIPRIKHLWAHWELLPMIKQVIGNGLKGIISFSSLGLRMIRIQGIGGVLAFSRGFGGIHKEGKTAVYQFVEAVNCREVDKLTRLFDESNVGIGFPAQEEPESPRTFAERVNMKLSVTKLLAAGQFVSCSFQNEKFSGIGIFEFSRKSKKIHSALFYF